MQADDTSRRAFLPVTFAPWFFFTILEEAASAFSISDLMGRPLWHLPLVWKFGLARLALSGRANYLLLGSMPVIWVAPWWVVLSGCFCIIQRVSLPPGRERKPGNSLNADKCASSLRDIFIHRVKYVISNYLGWVLLNINEYNSNWEEIERFVSHCCAFLL